MQPQTTEQKQYPSRAVLWSYVNPHDGYSVKFVQMQYYALTGPIPRAFIVRFSRSRDPKIIVSLEGRHPCARALKILSYLQRTRPNLLPKLTSYPFFLVDARLHRLFHTVQLRALKRSYQEMQYMKRLILTEKPSVAAEFARALNATKGSGYFESPDTTITYCIGHLLRLLTPEEYDPSYKHWSVEKLP